MYIFPGNRNGLRHDSSMSKKKCIFMSHLAKICANLRVVVTAFISLFMLLFIFPNNYIGMLLPHWCYFIFPEDICCLVISVVMLFFH